MGQRSHVLLAHKPCIKRVLHSRHHKRVEMRETAERREPVVERVIHGHHWERLMIKLVILFMFYLDILWRINGARFGFSGLEGRTVQEILYIRHHIRVEHVVRVRVDEMMVYMVWLGNYFFFITSGVPFFFITSGVPFFLNIRLMVYLVWLSNYFFFITFGVPFFLNIRLFAFLTFWGFLGCKFQHSFYSIYS